MATFQIYACTPENPQTFEIPKPQTQNKTRISGGPELKALHTLVQLKTHIAILGLC